MYTGAESIEHVNACHQERVRQLDRTARELEVQKLLAASDPDRESGRFLARLSALGAEIATRLRPARRIEQLPGN